MIRLTALPALIALAGAAILMPATASADDRYDRGDRDRGSYNDRHAEHEYREHRRNREREWREPERRERREHEWREHERREHRERSRSGYYDQFGYWHPDRY